LGTQANPRMLVSPAVARQLLESAGLKPSRSRGQNFLIDANILRIIVEAAGLSPSDTVVEVGAGLGALTQALIETGCRVYALESDARLVRILERELGYARNLVLIEDDAARFDFSSLMHAGPPVGVKMVSNLPYQIAATLVVRCLKQYPWMTDFVVTVQSEVAERLAGVPGSKEYSSASVKVQVRAAVSRVARVSRNSFYPRPRVDSTVLRLKRRELVGPSALLQGEGGEFFDGLVSAAFGQRRKKLVNALSSSGALGAGAAQLTQALRQLGKDEGSRAEDLSPDEFLKLARMLRT
jgi:16S rRNA (adenine1518-N6/adenine1519-N6)-dimethyltransferase